MVPGLPALRAVLEQRAVVVAVLDGLSDQVLASYLKRVAEPAGHDGYPGSSGLVVAGGGRGCSSSVESAVVGNGSGPDPVAEWVGAILSALAGMEQHALAIHTRRALLASLDAGRRPVVETCARCGTPSPRLVGVAGQRLCAWPCAATARRVARRR